MSTKDHDRKDDQKPKNFFGMEVSDTVTYLIVAVLTVIFIRQLIMLFQQL